MGYEDSRGMQGCYEDMLGLGFPRLAVSWEALGNKVFILLGLYWGPLLCKAAFGDSEVQVFMGCQTTPRLRPLAT